MTAKMEYADYLTRLARNSTKTEQEFNQEKLVREVGKIVSLEVLEKICIALECDLGDIAGFESTQKEECINE